MVNTDRLIVINRFNTPDYGGPEIALGETTSKYDNKHIKQFISDLAAKPDFKRPAPPAEIFFPNINIRKIENAFVCDSFLVFDKKYLYSDSSLKGGLGAFNEKEAIKWGAQKINLKIKNLSREYIDEPAVLVHNEGGGTWGHHLIQNFPKIIFLQKYYPNLKILLPREFCNSKSSRGKLLELYGIDKKMIIPLDSNTTYEFKDLYLLDFLFEPKSGFIHPWALDALRSVSKEWTTQQHDLIFVKRVGARGIQNQSDVETYLSKFGYKTLTQTHQNLEDQIKSWNSASNVVATLGSDMSNLVFMRENASLLSLSPDWFGDRFFYNLACASKINWFEVRCGEKGAISNSSHRFDNFHVDMETLRNSLELALPKIY